MKTLAFRGVAIFFILLVATSLMVDVMKMDFGTVNFWDKHNLFFLFFIAVFPRLTLLFSSVAFGGFLWWLGFFFCPRILVATLATVAYFHTNPVLVVLGWLVAIGGEVFEKWGIGKGKFHVHTNLGPKATYPGDFHEQPPHQPHTVIDKDGVIEAEFTKK